MATFVARPYRKATIVPVGHPAWDLHLDGPFQVTDSLTFEKIQGWLYEELFSLWREHLSQRERDNLSSVRFALVHRFDSAGHIGREEAESSDFAFKAFLCLRLVKPTKTNFEPIQIQFKNGGENKKIEVFSVTHPSMLWPNVPDAESLNSITLSDITKFKELLPVFLDVAANGPEHVRRAVRHFNAGYSEVRDPTIQIVVWCMGIESLFDVDEDPSEARLFAQVDKTVGLGTNIYESSYLEEFKNDVEGETRVAVGSRIADLFDIRNRFIHGRWIPAEWKNNYPRNSISGEKVHYVDVLRELASFVLRKGILNYLESRRAVKPLGPSSSRP
jgi:hypothetical protein